MNWSLPLVYLSLSHLRRQIHKTDGLTEDFGHVFANQRQFLRPALHYNRCSVTSRVGAQNCDVKNRRGQLHWSDNCLQDNSSAWTTQKTQPLLLTRCLYRAVP
jgi:hypothetical protein